MVDDHVPVVLPPESLRKIRESWRMIPAFEIDFDPVTGDKRSMVYRVADVQTFLTRRADELQKALSLAVRSQRERDAQIADAEAVARPYSGANTVAKRIAAAIRQGR